MSDTPIAFDLDALNFTKSNGVVTVVAQDAVTGVVLMIAHADRVALEKTLASGEMHYTSRTRGLWHKGATSGNVQRVVSLTADCDGDAVLARVVPAGPACHRDTVSCFGDTGIGADALSVLAQTIDARARTTETDDATGVRSTSYTARLLADRNLRLKKLGEEAVELSMACIDGDLANVAAEAADLVYHLLVAARGAGVTLDDVRNVLAQRRSGASSH